MTNGMEAGPSVGPMIDARPADRPARIVLPGTSIRLAPLDAALHADDLYAGSHGGGESVWTYLGDGPYPDRAGFRAGIEAKAASNDPLFYAIVDQHTQRAMGHATLMRIEPVHRVIEVGNILYLPALQRTRGATEAIFLLATYIFETLLYRRFEWKCNDLNEPSKRAAHRFGFTFEGLFRQHMIIKGRNRDTAWFSMLDHEWPARKAAFERWLSPDNFDAHGNQRQKLDMGLKAGSH